MADKANPTDARRIHGLDVARALAICGMVLVHLSMVMSGNVADSVPGGWFVNRLAGRPAMMFMLLAGIGISLRLSSADDLDRIAEIRRDLQRRGIFFLVFGYVFLTLWSDDILRVYGIGFLLASLLLTKADRWLWACTGITAIGIVGLLFVIDFETNWDFTTFEYSNLWTLSGGAMHLFYNGTRAVFPWVGILFVGMLVGRRNLQDARVRRRLLITGLIVWGVAEFVSHELIDRAAQHVDESEREDIAVIFGTDSFPSLPFFLLSGGGLSLAIILSCVEITERLRPALWQPLAMAGRMAFTWYVGHIVLLVGAGILVDSKEFAPMFESYLATLTFCVAMILASWGYLRRFRFGPLEWLLRTTTATRPH